MKKPLALCTAALVALGLAVVPALGAAADDVAPAAEIVEPTIEAPAVIETTPEEAAVAEPLPEPAPATVAEAAVTQVAARNVEAPTNYVTAAWSMPSWINSTTATWGQVLFGSEQTGETPNLAALDDEIAAYALTLPCETSAQFQVDVYKKSKTTGKLLDAGPGVAYLNGPGDPDEDLISGGWGTAYKLVLVEGPVCDPPVVNTVCESNAAGTHSTDLVDLWGNVDTRTKGHSEYVNDGLHVWTEDSSSQSKVSEGIAVNFPLSQTGQLAIDASAQPGNVYPYGPGLNLFVDITGDSVADGTLVYETVYGQDLWVTSGSAQALKDASVHTGGNGAENHGTIDHFLLTFPNATVVGLAYSLGSGVQGDWIINGTTANCVEHTFDIVDRPELPTPEPVLTFGEWTEGEPVCDNPDTEADESTVVQTRTRWSTLTPFKLIVLEGAYQTIPDLELAVTTQLVDEERTLTHEGECPVVEEPPVETPPTSTPVPAIPVGLADTGVDGVTGLIAITVFLLSLGALFGGIAAYRRHTDRTVD